MFPEYCLGRAALAELFCDWLWCPLRVGLTWPGSRLPLPGLPGPWLGRGEVLQRCAGSLSPL